MTRQPRRRTTLFPDVEDEVILSQKVGIEPVRAPGVSDCRSRRLVNERCLRRFASALTPIVWAAPKVRFALDSPLEERRFELLVPLQSRSHPEPLRQISQI